ncbi:MAG: hypothetical protein IT247_09660 [Bacteroidia bacterium]|nr:hypothetical protein [Bacteroidia bacterium]
MEKINSFELTLSNCLNNVRKIHASKKDYDDFLTYSYHLLHHELYRHGWFKVFSPDYFKQKYNLTFTDARYEAEVNKSLLALGYFSYLDDVVCFKDHYRYTIEPFGDIRKVSAKEYKERLKESGIVIPWKERHIYYIYFYFLICLIEAGSNREISKILSYHENKFAPDIKHIFKEQLRLILRDDPFREILDNDKKLTVTEWVNSDFNIPKPKLRPGLSFEIAARTFWEVKGGLRKKISEHSEGHDAFFKEIATSNQINPERLRKNYGTLSEGFTKKNTEENILLRKYTAKVIDSLSGEAKKLAKQFLS